MCEWKSQYHLYYQCQDTPLDGDPKGYCILHSPDKGKPHEAFTKKVEERMNQGRYYYRVTEDPPPGVSEHLTDKISYDSSRKLLVYSGVMSEGERDSLLKLSGDSEYRRAIWELFKSSRNEPIDLMGCHFPEGFIPNYFSGYTFERPVDFTDATFSQKANFREATFSQKVDFVGVKFIDDVDFFEVKFLKEAYFNLTKFSGRSYFIGATFSERAGFSQITFSQSANFNLAKFSQGASFWETIFFEKASFENVTFSKAGSFIRASFEKEAEFNGAIFKKAANFDQTSFKGKTDFTWAEFWDWTFFFKNSNETSVKLENPPPNVASLNYNYLEGKGKAHYDTLSERLIFAGVISKEEKGQLLKLSGDASYKNAIEELFKKSQNLTLGNPTTFHNARFLGKEVIFQDADLSLCSFLHSNIDKVDFRYCTFNEKKEKLFGIFPHRRQNVLRDEIDCDKGITKDYEPVRGLYLELKRNFEDKKDWNTAGDFHYGEMECRRKGRLGGRLDRFLVNAYYWASGYGERPWRALSWWVFSTLLFFPFLYHLSEHDPLSACVWDSVRVATFMRIGIPIEPESWGRIVLTLQYFICPTLLALFALALRRKVKR